MKKIFIHIVLIISIQYAYSQTKNIEQLKNWQLKGYAKSAERVGDYYSVIDYLEIYANRKPKNMKIAYKLANLYFKVKNYKKAEQLFYKVYKSNKKKNILSLYFYAQSLKTELKYDSALTCFTVFNEAINNNRKKTVYNYMAKLEIDACNYVIKNSYNKENTEVIHLNASINKIHMESAPIIFNDSTLIYSSVKVDTIPTIDVNSKNIKYESKFYTANYKTDMWIGGKDAPNPFYNFKNYNTSNGVFSLDKKRFYFTSGKRNWKNQMISSIYVSFKENDKWSKPVKLKNDINLKKYTSTQPAISSSYDEDFEVLYFISNRPNGFGGMDIWYVVYDKKTKKYKKPLNAGAYINTIADELTPFYSNKDSCLYFSSNGREGYGGFDIHKSKGSLVNWQKSENIGLPINSSYDDFYYRSFENKKSGFIVSNRDESLIYKNPNCCFDIYEFKTSENKVNLIAKIDKKNIKKIETKTDDKLLIISKIKKSISTKNKTSKNKNILITTSKKIKKDSENSESIVFNNIYFNYGKSILKYKSKLLIDTTLLAILNEYKNIIVEIGAHTDYKGSKEYNQNLSAKRAESVVSYLISKGIDKKRLVAVGYGETKPLFKAVDKTGKDIPQAREKNRRIEFKILGILSNK